MESENISDWLYIIFMAIAGLFSLIGSKNKKKRSPEILGQPEAEIVIKKQEEPQKSFWEIVQEKQDKPREVPQPASSPASISTDKKKQKPLKKTQPAPFLSIENAYHKPEPVNSLPDTILEEENIFTDIEFNNAAELRKAVIYTEILNRKY